MATISGQGFSESQAATPAYAARAAMADPAPLGLSALGITMLLFSAINAGWISASSTPVVLAIALPYGGISQALAGMWEFRRGNTFAATAFTSYGAFWISFVLLNTVFAKDIQAADVSAGLGLYLFAWGLFTLYMLIASLASARAVTAGFFLLTLTFFALSIGTWGQSATWNTVGGYLGIATAILALYISFANVTKAQFHRTVLPKGNGTDGHDDEWYLHNGR